MTKEEFVTYLQMFDPDAYIEPKGGIIVTSVVDTHVWVMRSPNYGKHQ